MASTHGPRQAFGLQEWLARNAHLLKPPVSNKLLFEDTALVVQIIGGPNQRVDFHDDPAEEFFYQLKGDMILKVAEGGRVFDVPIREGDVFLAGPHLRHSPQRPQPGSIGLVVEAPRQPGVKDGFEWLCFSCGELVHRVEVEVRDIVKDLPPLFERFYASEKLRTCGKCGTLHPGKAPPAGWVDLR
jgi:3-hydroxyanthranilate 3,4-dioxygenase